MMRPQRFAHNASAGCQAVSQLADYQQLALFQESSEMMPRSCRLVNAALSAFALFCLFCAVGKAQSGMLAATPPMGWNSWNHFADKVTDRDVRRAADVIVLSGMRDAGYLYINIDDGWEGNRDSKGHIQANSKFPDMKALADYVHAKGLKLGIYSSPGPKTCGGYEGSYGHEQEDANTYAAWGIDFLKYDLCSYMDIMKLHDSHQDPQKALAMMQAAYTRRCTKRW